MKHSRQRTLHRLGIFCGVAAALWLAGAEAPTKLVTVSVSPLVISFMMVFGAFMAGQRDIPAPSSNRNADTVELPALETSKIELYRAMRAQKVGTQHVIESRDLDELLGPDTLPVPDGWTRTLSGEPMPDTVAALRRSRAGH